MGIFDLILGLLVADFLSGLIHWAQDLYLSPYRGSRVSQRMASENAYHHIYPLHILLTPWWREVRNPITYLSPIAGLFIYFGFYTGGWAVIFLSLTQVFHRVAHIKDAGRVVALLRWLGVLCDYSTHLAHHYKGLAPCLKHESTMGFCVITGWLNPILDLTRFFHGLECLLSLFGVRRLGHGIRG